MTTVVPVDCITHPRQEHKTIVSIIKGNGYKIACYAFNPEMEND